MRALVLEGGDLEVVEVADPTPGKGQLVLDVTACGICGSDLHARHHADDLADDVAASGYSTFMRADQRVVMGHEFSGVVVEAGPGTRRRTGGGPVVALPMVRLGKDVRLTGLDAAAPGGYAERVLVQESMTLDVPNGLDPELAALTEPLAVALHAVRKGQVGKKQTAVVIGCGPIGLGVIAMLKASGVRTVVASDFSPARRALAAAMGADVVVDPASDSPWEARPKGFMDAPKVLDLAVTSMDRLRSVPLVPWHRVMGLAERAGALPSGPVVFECVGVPGMIGRVMAEAPMYTRVVVVGVCMGVDTIRPSAGINKEVELRFVFGYTPTEFREALHMMGEGTVDPSPLVTGRVPLDGAARAFEDLADPEAHAKILVTPHR